LAERENTAFHPTLSALTSDEQGRWSMNQMPLGKGLHILASHPDYAATEIGTWAAPGMPTNVVLVLTNGFPVHGQVLSAEGLPVPGALVSKMSGASRCTKTDEEGRFTWSRVEPGKVWVNVRADGFNELNQAIQVTNGPNDALLEIVGSPGRVEARLDQGNTIRLVGSVIDAETQQPIPVFKVLRGTTHPFGFASSEGAPLSDARFLGEGHDGQFDWQVNRIEPGFVLQVQADGYLPAVSAPQPMLQFKLHRSRTLEGLIRTPDGAPAEAATVSLSGMGFGCTMQKEGQLLPPNAGFVATRTQTSSEGRFSLQSITGAQALVAVHRSGYAYLPIGMASNAVMTLEPWGAIEGVVYVGERAAPREFVRVDGVQRVPGKSRFALSFSYQTQSDPDGHFRFDYLPTGDHVVARMVNYVEGQTCSPLDSSTALVAVRSGQTTLLELRGQGRVVVGRVALTDPEAELSRGMSQAFLLLDGSKAPQSTDFQNPGEHCRALQLYNDQTKFPSAFQPNGAIRADDAPPGTYTLEIELLASTPDPINMRKSLGSLEQRVIVPPGDSILDLGTLQVRWENERFRNR